MQCAKKIQNFLHHALYDGMIRPTSEVGRRKTALDGRDRRNVNPLYPRGAKRHLSGKFKCIPYAIITITIHAVQYTS